MMFVSRDSIQLTVMRLLLLLMMLMM